MWRSIILLIMLSCKTLKADELVELLYSFSGNDGDSEVYLIDLPEGVLELTVESSGNTGDVDIFLYQPGEDDYLDFSFCSNRRQSSFETCELGTPKAGLYQLEAKSFQSNSIATLRVAYRINREYQPSSIDKYINTLGTLRRPLLNLDESRLIEFIESAVFKTFSHPNRRRLSVIVEQSDEDVVLKIKQKGYSSSKDNACEVTINKQTSGKCDIHWPDGLYTIELTPRNLNESKQVIRAKVTVQTEVDTTSIDSAWRDREVKALKWGVPKKLPKGVLNKKYFFETRPRRGKNAVSIISPRPEPLFGAVSIGLDLLQQPNINNCYWYMGNNKIVCRYNLSVIKPADLLRVKVNMETTLFDLEVLHGRYDSSGFPSPTCPTNKGCEGEPDI